MFRASNCAYGYGRKLRTSNWFGAALFGFRMGSACLSLTFLIWGIQNKSADPLFRFVRNGKAGYIDSSGKIVIQPTLLADDTQFSEFHEGLLAVKQDPGYGYMDRSGNVVLHADVWLALDFSEGLAPAPISQLNRPPKWGFIDRTGHFAIPPQYFGVEGFSEGLTRVSVSSEVGSTGYIDSDGKFIIPPRLTYGSSSHEGRAAVIIGGPCRITNACARPEFQPTPPGAAYDCRYAFIDKSGKPVSDLRFDDAKDFAEGLAPVRRGREWGYVDRTGRISIAPRFDRAEPFSEGLAAAVQNGKTVRASRRFLANRDFELLAWFI